MRRIDELMKDLGFKKDSDLETQKAFIRHLVQSAEVSIKQTQSKKLKDLPQQLSFALEEAIHVSQSEFEQHESKISKKRSA